MSIHESGNDPDASAAIEQTAVSDADLLAASKSVYTTNPQKSILGEWGTVLIFAVPLALVIYASSLVWTTNRDDVESDGEARGRIMSWAAWLGGREYDPKEDAFSGEMKMQLPDVKPVDLTKVTRNREEFLRSNQEHMSRQLQKASNRP